MASEKLTFIVTAERVAGRFRWHRASAGYVLSLSIETIRGVLRLNRHLLDLKTIDAPWLRDRIQEWAHELEGRPRVHLDEVKRALAQVLREPVQLGNARKHARLISERTARQEQQR